MEKKFIKINKDVFKDLEYKIEIPTIKCNECGEDMLDTPTNRLANTPHREEHKPNAASVNFKAYDNLHKQALEDADIHETQVGEPEESPCLCKDKGVIELIEEAVEAERARVITELFEYADEVIEDEKFLRFWFKASVRDALQVINNEEKRGDNKWM